MGLRQTSGLCVVQEFPCSAGRIWNWRLGNQVQIVHRSPYHSLLLDKTHHPWERSTDENTNGLLGDWFPKGVSLDDVSDSEVQETCDSLSRRPRRRLKWKCPWEVYHHQSLHLL